MRKIILLLFVALVLAGQTQAQTAPVAFVNELYNSNEPNEEWTEIIVLQDNLNLSGYFLGDNNGSTNSWQPKLEFKNIPLWQHLRAGTYIIISHAKTTGACSAFREDTDAADGLIKVCSFTTNSPYFDGGSASATLNLSSSGDFVHLVSPTGQMIQGIGYDANPGGSVTGGTCYNGGADYQDIGASVDDRRPCGRYLFLEENIGATQSIGYLGGTETGMVPTPGVRYNQSAPTNLLDFPFTATQGNGNSLPNIELIRRLRQPSWPDTATTCTQRLIDPAFGNTITFTPINYPNAVDRTLHYFVVRYPSKPTVADLLPIDGREYTVGTALGRGTVIGLLPHFSGGQVTNGTFADVSSGVSYDSHYRIFAARYRNPAGNNPIVEVDRGIAYNTTQFSSARPGSPVTLTGPASFCTLDSAVYTASFTGQQDVVFSSNTAGVRVVASGSRATVRITSEFPATATEFRLRAFPPVGGGPCSGPDSITVRVIRPVPIQLSAPTTICFGDTALITLSGLVGDSITFSSNLAGVGFAPYLGVGIPEDRYQLVFLTQAVSATTPFTVFATPFASANCRVQGSLAMTALPKPVLTFVGDTNIAPGEETTIKVQGGRSPFTVSPTGLLVQDTVTYISRDTASRVYMFRSAAAFGSSTPCIAKGTLRIVVSPYPPVFVPNMVAKTGKFANRTFAITGASVTQLSIYSRWGQRVLDKTNYQNDWAGEPGVYFFKADLALPNGRMQLAQGWVEVVE